MRLLNLDLKRSLSLGCCSVFDGEGEGVVDVEDCRGGSGLDDSSSRKSKRRRV